MKGAQTACRCTQSLSLPAPQFNLQILVLVVYGFRADLKVRLVEQNSVRYCNGKKK